MHSGATNGDWFSPTMLIVLGSDHGRIVFLPQMSDTRAGW